ncbi:MAG: signal peptidase I [Terriglobia bacterium]
MTSKKQDKKRPTFREYFDSLLVTAILALFGTTFILQAFKIPSSSMEKTLLVGDHLLVNKFGFAGAPGEGRGLLPYRRVQRGDIVVFKYPEPPHRHFVKRIIGLPGDRLKIVKRQVFINGEPLPEPYKIHRDTFAHPDFRDHFPPENSFLFREMNPEWVAVIEQQRASDELIIPPGKYFVMGDNRDRSSDSRYWGLVDRKNIVGRPLFIYWSYGSPRDRTRPGGLVQHLVALWDTLVHFFSRIRWDRLLHVVR